MIRRTCVSKHFHQFIMLFVRWSGLALVSLSPVIACSTRDNISDDCFLLPCLCGVWVLFTFFTCFLRLFRAIGSVGNQSVRRSGKLSAAASPSGTLVLGRGSFRLSLEPGLASTSRRRREFLQQRESYLGEMSY